MIMTDKEKLFLIKKIGDYYHQKKLPILGLTITGNSPFNQEENIYECDIIDDSNVEDVFKYILKNRLSNPELFYYIFENITFGKIYNISNFFERILKEELIPKDISKIIHFLTVTNKETIGAGSLNSQYKLFKTLQKIFSPEYFEKLNEIFSEVSKKISQETKEEICYKFEINLILFSEKSGILGDNTIAYYAHISDMIEPIKKILKFEVRNIHSFTIGSPKEDIELIFIGTDINKYKAFVEYLTTNFHNYLAEYKLTHNGSPESKQQHIEMFLLKFELEYSTEDKSTTDIESKLKI